MGEVLTIPMPAEGDLGPKMRQLTALQRRFVVAWFHHSGNATRAALSAGYSTSSPGVAGHLCFHNPKVQAAIQEFAETIIKTEHLALAMSAISELLTDRGIEPAVRANLAKHVQAQVGLGPKVESKLIVEHVDRQEQLRLLIRYAKETGRDPREVLGECPDITDADYEILELEAPPEEGRKGLEDLL